jgi:hypothetical protein
MALKRVNEDVNEPQVSQRKEEVKETQVERVDISQPTISLAEVQKLLADQEKRWEERLNKLKTTADVINESVNDEEYINNLSNDWMEEPATFFVFSSTYGLYGDKVKGKFTAPPHGAIKFSNVIRTRQRTSNGEKIISVSSCKVHSKATAEYIRSCSAFGFEIFEDMDSIKNIDATWAQKLVESSNVVSNFSDQAVIARCKQEGIQMSTDITGLRRELTTLLAKRNAEQHRNLVEAKLRNANVDENKRMYTEKP